MAQNPQAPRTVTMTEFSPEILATILSYLPQKDVIDNVSLTCTMWRDVARSLHTSLRIPMELGDMSGHNKRVTSENISKLLKKTTRLEKLAIENFAGRVSEADIDFFSRFLVSQLKEIEMWRDNFPERMSSFTMTFRDINFFVPLDDRIRFDKAILLHFQKISGLLHFQLEAIFVDPMDVIAEFCTTGSNCKKGHSLTAKCVYNTVRLGIFLNFSRDNLQKIYLQNCQLSRDNLLTLKTLSSMRDLSLCATGNLEDFKFLFDKSCQLRFLEFLEVDMRLDAEAVRNVGNCCGNSLRHLSIPSDRRYGSNVTEQQPDEWVACLESFSALKECKLGRLTMSPEHWVSIFGRDGALKNLKMLELSFVDILSASTFAKIAEFSGDTLKRLRFWASRPLVSPQDCAEHVRRLHALEDLNIGGGCFENYTHQTQFFDKLFGTGSQLTRLTSFDLNDLTHLDESWVAGLVNCCGKNLKRLYLRLDDGEIPDACLSRLKHFSKLEVLSIEGDSPGIGFSSAAWSNLFDGQSELYNLRDVSLPYTDVDDGCLKNLAKLCGQNLKKLVVFNCKKVTESGISVVKEMCGSGLELLHVDHDDSGDDDDDGSDDDDGGGSGDDDDGGVSSDDNHGDDEI